MRNYERQFVSAIVSVLKNAGLCFAQDPIQPYHEVIRGSTSSEAEGVIFLDSATIILEIDKKSFPSDNVVRYHRALAQKLLRPEVRGGQLVLVHALITKGIRPLRVENAKYMGELLRRDFGVHYISAESKTEDISCLVQQIESNLLGVLTPKGCPG